MPALHRRRAILAIITLATVAAFPAPTGAQTPFRGACDLVDDQAVSDALGSAVTSQRTGTRAQCSYTGSEGGYATIWLDSDADMSMFAAQEGVEPVTVADLDGLWWPSQNRLILTLPEGGLLDLSMAGLEVASMDPVSALAEAILATGPLTAVPPDKRQTEGLYLAGAMCDVFTPDEVNAITGGTYGPLDFPPEADDPNCTYEDPSGFVIAVLSNDFGKTVDTGTYTSEDLTVADRPAIWEPDREFLTLDAGDARTLAVGFSSNEPDPVAHRDQAIALAEAIIPKLGTEAPPEPETAECTASLEELSRITGVEITSATPFGPVCFYMSSSGTQQGALIGILPGDDPAAALEAADFSSSVEPTSTDFDGHAALQVDAPEGASLAVDLDGLPGGDGQVLIVAVGGLPAGSDQMAVAGELVRYLISTM
jgi:hypothetical protein